MVPWYELKHPNITPFIGYIFDGRSARMLSKWQEGGNVREYMQRYPVNRLCLVRSVPEEPSLLLIGPYLVGLV